MLGRQLLIIFLFVLLGTVLVHAAIPTDYIDHFPLDYPEYNGSGEYGNISVVASQFTSADFPSSFNASFGDQFRTSATNNVDYFDYGDITVLDGSSAMTMCGWANFANATASGTNIFMVFGKRGSFDFSWCSGAPGACTTTGQVYFALTTSSGTTDLHTSTVFTDDKYRFYCTWYDGSAAKIYVDGVQNASVAHTGSLTNTAGNFGIGKYKSGANYFGRQFSIDEVYLFNRALNTSEMLDLRKGSSTPSDSCTYPGSGDWEIDISDNCALDTEVDIGSNRLIISGDGGTLEVSANIYAKEIHRVPTDFDGDFKIVLLSGGALNAIN